MTPDRIVLSLLPEAETDAIRNRRPRVDFAHIRPGHEPGPLHGDALLLEGPPDNIEDYLEAGVSWVHTLATGVERFPLDAMRRVDFTCSRGSAGPAIAEWVLAVMLAYEKQLPQAWVNDRGNASWFRADLGGLRGKTLGLIGMGGIGNEIVRRAVAFDMKVVALRRHPAPEPLTGVTMATDLNQILPLVDHLVLAVPETAATRGMLDEQAFARLKPGVHLVNIARGSLIDQEALRKALDCGTVARASLDVATPEPLPDGHWLYSHPAVRISPHISWSAPGQRERVLEIFLDNLDRFLEGRPLLNRVDVDAGY
jgi:phosphoglycerate dehydrogenase-like enzyme